MTPTTTVHPATGTAITSGLRLVLLLVGGVAISVGCGTSTDNGHGIASVKPRAAASLPPAFAWLRDAAPSGWPMIRVSSGAAMVYPPGWHLAHGDPGTATAVALDAHGHYLGYLNLTPRQANEQLASWPTFRLAHNSDEGDRGVVSLAQATDLPFRTGTGSCVEDDYTTRTGSHFREIACLVTSFRTASVIVGAAPPAQWSAVAPLLQNAVASVRT